MYNLAESHFARKETSLVQISAQCEIGTVYEDVTPDVLGAMGTWQWIITVAITILMVPTILNPYQDMFLLEPSERVACVPEHSDVINVTLCSFYVPSNVTEEIKCNRWQLKLLGLFRLERTWLIYCDDKFKLLSTTVICRLGFMFGCVIFGLISDSFGRKKAILINICAEAVHGLILTFCNSEAWFRLLIFLRSLFASANFFVGIILICEIASNSWRTFLIMMVALPRVVATTYAMPLANSLPNLETLNFTACLFCIVCIAPLRWLPESPHWLMYSRKISMAEKVLYKAAAKNKIKLCSDFRIRPVNHKAYNAIDEERTCVSIFYTYNTRILLIFSLLFWAVYNFLWSFLFVTTYSKHSRRPFMEIFGFFGLFGCLTLLLSKRLKLKHLLLVNVALVGFFAAGVIIINRFETEHISFGVVQSAALSIGMIGHSLLLNITPRLFAINIRGTIFGCCHSSGQLGTIVCYVIFLLDVADHKSLVFIQMAATFVLSALCYVIPDVDGRELPDIIEDMDYFSELTKPLRWATQKTNSPSQEEVEMRIYSFGSTVRNASINSCPIERTPAQRIGFTKLWYACVNFARKMLSFKSLL